MLALTALFCVTASAVSAQNRTITGRVVGSDSSPVIGASIFVTDGQHKTSPLAGTTTDVNGKYSLSIPANAAEITAQFIGYESQTQKIGGGRTAFDFTLDDSSVMMEEVVAIGYAKVKRKDLTGSSVSVMGDDLKNVPVTTAAQALTGKAAGVNIVTQSGAPGADINITVHDGSSVTQSTTPLYIVDGFAMENGLQNVDINDIATIDVLKDASATAIYGAQGSNGVILITTKSGKAGKTSVQYNTYFSFEKLGKKLDLLDVADYVKYQYEFQTYAGNIDKWTDMFGGDKTAADFYTGAYDRIARDYGSRAGIDWQDEVFGGYALTQNHNVSITGGTDKTQFMLSYNYNDQDGIMARHGYKKNSVRAKINHELWKGVRLDFNTNFQSTNIEGGGSLGGTLKKTILQPVTGGIRYTNDQMLHVDLGDEMAALDSQYDLNNPILENNAVQQNKITRQYSVNAGVEIDLYKGLTWRTAGSYIWSQARSDYWDDGTTRSARDYKTEEQDEIHPWGKRDNSEKYSYQITNTLSYGNTFADKHTLNLLLGQETLYSESMSLKNTYYGFPENNFGLNDVSMAKSYSRSSSIGKSSIVSVFARAMYNYDNRYLVTATVRGDGSSKFSKGNKWGFFPSASAAWRISEERFWKDNGVSEVIDNLKLRVGYGTSGNCNIDNNMYATDYGSGHYAIGNADVSTLKPGDTVGNPNLKWETTTSTNVGLDLSLLRNRINLSVDWYNNQSNDLLIKNNIPTSTGYKYQYQNIGSVRNRGFEIVLNTVNINAGGFRWTTDFNISFNRSKVLAIYGESGDDYFTRSQESGHCMYMIKVGQPLGQFYGYIYDGVYTTDMFDQSTDKNGDPIYTLKKGIPYDKNRKRSDVQPGDMKLRGLRDAVDADGEPVFNSTSNDDRTVIGQAQPKFTGGFQNTFTYKGFDLNIFMNFSYGNKIFNMSSQRFIGPYLPNQNSLSVMKSRFTLLDPATGEETFDLARLAELNPNQHDRRAMWSIKSDNKLAITCPMDYYVEDGSFLRLNTITLGYSLPKRLLTRAHINSLRVYVTLNNIHTFTGYSGYDPEVSSTSSILSAGMDSSSYPRAKSYVVGLNLTF